MYAIIEDSGTQIKVSTGDVIEINHRDLGDSQTVTFDRVLAIGRDDTVATIGTPYVAGASVTAEVLEVFRDRKIDVIKFRRRKGYARKQGHRQPMVRVKVGDIKG